MHFRSHEIFFIDEAFSISSKKVQDAFAGINQRGSLYSLFYLDEPMHWVYFLEVLPLEEMVIIPFEDLDLPYVKDMDHILDVLSLVHECFEFEKSNIHWFSKTTLPDRLLSLENFVIFQETMR